MTAAAVAATAAVAFRQVWLHLLLSLPEAAATVADVQRDVGSRGLLL